MSAVFHIQHHERIGSTNDEARRLAAAGAPHGTVVHADEQASGRGRFGRTWFSPPGNLYLSVLLRLELPPERSSELSFVTALTVADAIDALLPKQSKSTLKWPNDVLVNDGKIAGILVESADDAHIIGIGVNVLEAPRNAPYKTATLVGAGGIATVDGARDILLDSLAKHLDAWTEHGFNPIRAAWLARAHPIGTLLRASIGGRSEEGLFAGLDEAGAMLLDTTEGRKRIVAAEVSAPAT
ncbi:MAG: biotin--[acetyl-CoA-carboxylase] ligase [Acetobacteraceae bacterium]|jgi:BirA family biotin operon repressor/biotin-[acetyl-CoA-carboxylase] ligase